MTDSEKRRPATRSKVGRLIAERELDGLGEELEGRWVGDGYDEHGLRALADLFNERLVRDAMESAGLSPLGGEAANVYRLLTDEDVSSGDRTTARRRLEREGVDVDALESSFVSHRAVHTYLTKYRDASKTDGREERGDRGERARERIGRLRGRLRSVVRDAVAGLRDADRLAIGGFEVIVTARVVCEDCGTHHDVEDLLAEAGCPCRASDGA